MFGDYLYDILFFAIPVLLVVLFGISLYRYLHAKNREKHAPGIVSREELRRRKIWLIVFSVMAGATLAVVAGFLGLLFMAIAYM